MQSGIDNNQTVKDVEIKEEEPVESTQAELENYAPLTENPPKTLAPCIKTRGSFENFIETPDKSKKNPHYKSLLNKKSQNSDSNLIKPSGLSKILTWDPWLKIGRNKNKKDKRKNEEKKEKLTVVADQKTGDGPQFVPQDKKDEIPPEPPFEVEVSEVVEPELVEDNLNPRPAKVRKIVRFNSDVKVVHFMDDEILGHSIEPLKKELEQQERNKELRKEFSPETGLGLKQSLKKSASDYMAAWYKR